MRQTENPEDSLAIPGGPWAVPDEGFNNSEAIQERKRVEGPGMSKCSRVSHLCIQLFLTPWTVACQLPVSMESSKQEHWSGLLFLPPGDLPHPGIESMLSALQADSLPTEPPGMSSWSLFLLGEIFLSQRA